MPVDLRTGLARDGWDSSSSGGCMKMQNCLLSRWRLTQIVYPLPPFGHVWDAMLVRRKGNINRTVSVLQYCGAQSIIMVHEGASSSYRLIDCIGLWTCFVYLYFPSASVSLIFMLHWCYILEYSDSEKHIRFSTSLPYRHIGYYHCQMSTLSHSHNFTDVGCEVSYNNSGRIEWPIFEQNESIRIAYRNALLYIHLYKFFCYIIYFTFYWAEPGEWRDWPLIRLTNRRPSVLQHCWLRLCDPENRPRNDCNVSSGTLQ